MVTKRSYVTLRGGALKEIGPGELFSGRDVTPAHNPYRKVVLETPHGLLSFNLEDVVVQIVV